MKRGFTWIELLVILGVIALAVALATPVFLHAREASWRARCLSHLRSLSNSISIYSAANTDTLPLSMPADAQRYYPNREAKVPAESHVDSVFWANAISSKDDLTCQVLDAPLAYVYNGYLHGLPKSIAKNPKQLITLWEGFGKSPRNLASPRLECGNTSTPCTFQDAEIKTIAEPPRATAWTHGRGANFLFLDGHAAWRRLGDHTDTPTDPRRDPFHEYDRAGRVDRFWMDDYGRAPLFRP